MKFNRDSMTLEFDSIECVGEDKDGENEFTGFPTIIHLSEIIHISDIKKHSNRLKSNSNTVLQTRLRQYYVSESREEVFSYFRQYYEMGTIINNLNKENSEKTMNFLKQIVENTKK